MDWSIGHDGTNFPGRRRAGGRPVDRRRARAADGFDLVVLGALGGIQDGNLSASLVHPHGDNRAVTFDAGTLVNGLRVAEEKGAFAAITRAGRFARRAASATCSPPRSRAT